MHYDAYHRLAHGVGPISRRPDLIGQATTGEWIAIEAKGRTNGWTDHLRDSAKTQARTLDQVVHPGGVVEPIEANVASISYFDGEGWCLLMDDPPAKPQPLRLTSSTDDLHRAYYGPVLDYLSVALEQDEAESVEIGRAGFKVAYDPDLDLFVGVANAVIETSGASIDTVRAALAEILEAHEGNNLRHVPQVEDEVGREWSLGADGVIVRLGERWQ